MVTTSGSFSGVSSTQEAQAFHIEPPQEEVEFPGSGTSQLLEVLPTRVMAQQKRFQVELRWLQFRANGQP